MDAATLLIVDGPPARTPRLGLWSELNRIVEGAAALARQLRAIHDAAPSSSAAQRDDDLRALSRLVTELELARLGSDVEPVAAADPCDQAHVPGLWDLRVALLEAMHHVDRLLASRGEPDFRDLLHRTQAAAEQLDVVVAKGRLITAPDVVRRALDGRSVGAAVRLSAIFDDLADEDAVKALAEQLEARCGDVYVDTKQGVVIKKSTSPWARAGTYVAPLLWLALGALAVLLPTGSLLDLDLAALWNGDAVEPARAYALVATGVVLHVLVTAQKQRQSQVGAPLPVGSPLDWLHTRWAGVALTFVWMVVVVYGLGLNGMTPSGAKEHAYAFVFAGFSVDSVAGIFLTRFDPLAQKGLASLTERFGSPASGT